VTRVEEEKTEEVARVEEADLEIRGDGILPQWWRL
jgi:hypothetical protein